MKPMIVEPMDSGSLEFSAKTPINFYVYSENEAKSFPNHCDKEPP